LTAALGDEYPLSLSPLPPAQIGATLESSPVSPGCPQPGSALPKLPQPEGDYNLWPDALSIPCCPAAPKTCRLFSRHSKQPKLPKLPKQQLRTMPVTQRNGGSRGKDSCCLQALRRKARGRDDKLGCSGRDYRNVSVAPLNLQQAISLAGTKQRGSAIGADETWQRTTPFSLFLVKALAHC